MITLERNYTCLNKYCTRCLLEATKQQHRTHKTLALNYSPGLSACAVAQKLQIGPIKNESERTGESSLHVGGEGNERGEGGIECLPRRKETSEAAKKIVNEK
jgi:hypothetical protein